MNINKFSGKAYGSIPHLPESRLGKGDHKINEGMTKIATKTPRDWKDVVIVTEKLDGSCCAVYKESNNNIIALTKSGNIACKSELRHLQLFNYWVCKYQRIFNLLLEDGERCVGEWLAQAHGTIYKLKHEPYVVFDIMRGKNRVCYQELIYRCYKYGIITPKLISFGLPISVKNVLPRIQISGHGAVDPVEGAVWRVERNGKFDFITKYVRHDKIDGKYIPELRDNKVGKPIWNWEP